MIRRLIEKIKEMFTKQNTPLFLMPNTTKLIQLSAEELIMLIKEKVIQRGDICIASNSSFLKVLSLLDDEMAKELPYAKSKQL